MFILFKLTAEAGFCGIILLLLPFYGHYTGQPALAGTPVKNKSFTACMSFQDDPERLPLQRSGRDHQGVHVTPSNET